MSGVPRSQPLIAHVFNVSGSSPAFICPDGYTTLVKSFVFVNSGSLTARASLVFTRSGVGFVASYSHYDVPTNEDRFYDVWVALGPGDAVFVDTDSESSSCWVSGAVLAGAPQFPPASRNLPTQLPRFMMGRPG